MVQLVRNFVKTSLRAPISASDTALLLATGSGAWFVIPAGDWCYLTVNDSANAEVMKYVSTGTVTNDTITVTRAQDNSSAKAFATGSCVAEGWNVGQVQGLIDQSIAATPMPSDTIVVPSTPTAAPEPGIRYAVTGSDVGVLYTPGQLWYWQTEAVNGTPLATPVWVPIASNGIMMVDSVPSAAPASGVVWAVNPNLNLLYYWTGTTWIPLSGQGSSGGLIETLSFEYLNQAGRLLTAGFTYSIPDLLLMTPSFDFQNVLQYKANPNASDIIFIPVPLPGNPTPPNLYRYTFLTDCVVQMSASINCFVADISKSMQVDLLLTGTGGYTAFGTNVYKPIGSSNINAFMSVVSGPISVKEGDAWTANFSIEDGSGAMITQVRIDAEILALLV